MNGLRVPPPPTSLQFGYYLVFTSIFLVIFVARIAEFLALLLETNSEAFVLFFNPSNSRFIIVYSFTPATGSRPFLLCRQTWDELVIPLNT